jgi:MFS family permease
MRSRLRVLRHPAFRNLWFAQSTSVLGDRLVFVALALFVTDLTGKATDVGLVLGAQTIPLVAFLLVGGVWADRLPRARLMVASDVARAGLHALLATLIFLETVEIWHIVLIEVLFGTAEAFFRPAYTGLLPLTVPPPAMQEAQALSNMTNNVAELAGPALATALVLGLGAGWAFALDAATFVASAAFTARVRTRDEAAPASGRRTLLAELREGFGHVRSRPWIWVTVVVYAAAVPVGYAPLFVLGPTIATESYDLPAVFGLVTTLFGVGAVAGAIAGLRWRPRRPMRAGFLVLAAWPLLLVVFGAAAPIVVVLVFAAGTGIGFALFDVWWNTAMAERVPASALSRVSSYDWMGSIVLLPIGFLLAGPAAEATSPEAVMVVGGILTAGLLVLGLVPRETRRLPRVERAPSPAVEMRVLP